MAEKSGTPLDGITDFPAEARARLGELWITTAEELVSAAVTGAGPAALAQHLGLSQQETNRLIEVALAALPPGVSFAPGDVEPHGLGALDEPADEEPRGPVSFAPLPPKVDLHEQMPPVRNQGQRGTCVSFACTAVHEYLLGERYPQDSLSEQFLYWNCKRKDLYPGAGTFIHVGMDCLLTDGQPNEQVWPYNPTPVNGNEGQDPPPEGALERAAGYRITGNKKLPARSVQDLRQALADNLPIAFAVPVYTYWFTEPARSAGDIRLPLAGDKKEGGHAMAMVGYEDDPSVPGGGYFIIRNSWDTTWASKSKVAPGYARLPYAYMQQYASAAHTAEIVKKEEEKKAQNVDWMARLYETLRKIFGKRM